MSTEKLPNVPRPEILSTTSTVIRRPLQYLLWTTLLILYIHYITRQPPPYLPSPHPTPLEPIPTKIWQIFPNYTPIDPYLPSIQTWITQNQDYQYTLVSAAGGNAFALKHYANRREILYPFLSLRDPMLRADLLRYMLLESEGGIYSDLSTIGIKPVSEWIPPNLASKIHAIIAIEHDNREDIEDPYPDIQAPRLHFSQRIIATSRGHPLMSHMITNVMDALQALAVDKNATTIAELRPTDDEVVRVSGEGVWTRAVLKTLGERMGEEMGMGNSTGMRGPRVFGDVLVLPVGGFGRGGEGEGVVRYGWERRGRRGWGD